MVVVRHYILNAFAVLVLLSACSAASFGLAVSGSSAQAVYASGNLPDPGVVALMVSALATAALWRRVHRRTAKGFCNPSLVSNTALRSRKSKAEPGRLGLLLY